MRPEVTLQREALVRSLEDRTWFEVAPGERIAIRIRGEEVGGAFSIVEGILAPASGPPLHIHDNEDELIEVLDGSLRMVCNGEEFDVQAGALVVIPKGAAHTWRNNTDKAVRARATFIPGGAEAMFEALAGKPVEEAGAIASLYGCRFIGPPL